MSWLALKTFYENVSLVRRMFIFRFLRDEQIEGLFLGLKSLQAQRQGWAS